MRIVIACTVSMLLTGSAIAAESADSSTFYASRPGSVFTFTSPQSLTIGFVENMKDDELPYQTWEGRIFGRKQLYLELHRNKLMLIAERRKFIIGLESAFKLPSEQPATLDFRGTDLYVHPGKTVHDSILCIESLLAEAGRSTPHRSVFLVTDPLGAPRLYQVPTLYASCKGLAKVKPGIYTVPGWSALADTTPPIFRIQFYKLGKTGFTATGQPATATGVGDQTDKFVIDIIDGSRH